MAGYFADAYALSHRLDARIAAGVVSQQGLSTLLCQYIQAVEAGFSHSNRKNRRNRVSRTRGAGLSTPNVQPAQWLGGDSIHSNPEFRIPKRRRGGQHGNENRRIHGLYSQESLTVAREGRALLVAIKACETLIQPRKS
ncbi:MAG: hypothetical protein JSR60_12735 [Proteobacteria bacterium]|nr:hypothetical protein [Pseudomonadota bacterium]